MEVIYEDMGGLSLKIFDHHLRSKQSFLLSNSEVSSLQESLPESHEVGDAVQAGSSKLRISSQMFYTPFAH